MDQVNGLRRETLDNGLTVLLREMHHAPVVTFWVWYRVGSRVEQPPRTGLTHWVEHMLFRGADRFPGSHIHKLIAREGGNRNGFTSNDYTAYYETLPASRYDLALQIEADRMLNARFDAEDVEAERTIILSERAGRENQASYRLREQVLATAFPNHGYGYPVIGFEADLRRITRQELWRHYRTYYGPDNAIAVAVGRFNSAEMLTRIEELFGPAQPRGPEAVMADHAQEAASLDREPTQTEQRRTLVTGREPTAYLQILFPAPNASHGDFFPLLILNTILGGAGAMGLGGGGGNRTSRLYRALVNTELAAGTGCSIRPTAAPFAFTVVATARQGVDLRRIEEAIWAEVQRALSEPIDGAELERACKQTLAQFAYSSESISQQGYWLGLSEVVASAEWFTAFPGQLTAVTAEDVRRVALTYLRPDKATVGWYTPE